MSLELGPQSYNRLPEASYRDMRYIDVSHWAEGDRVRGILGNNFGARKARATFSTKPGDFGNEPVTILLPGTLIPASQTFQDQIPVMQELGKPVLIDYSNDSFSTEMLGAQIMDFIDSPLARDRRVDLVGVSLGAANIIDLLLEESEARDRVDRVVLLGALYSSHDLKPGRLQNFLKKAKEKGLINNSTVRAAMPFARHKIKVDHDPKLAEQEDVIKESVGHVTDRALSERIHSILRRDPIEEQAQLDSPPALLIHWQNDESEARRQVKLANVFTHSRLNIVSGKHGWTLTSGVGINSMLVRFLAASMAEEFRLAA